MNKINDTYEILTPYGFKKFDSIKTTIKSEYIKISLKNGKYIICSINHPFYINGQKILATELTDKTRLNSSTGYEEIKNIETIKNNITLFDIINVGDKHIFYANDIAVFNCDGSFLSSGDNVIPPEIIEYYNQTFVCEPIQKAGFDNNVWIWEHPDYSRNYMITADVGRGDAEDYSAFHIFDVESLTQVAEYQGKTQTADFGNLLVEYATKYNDALLVIENNGIGWAVIQKALDRQYKNLFYTEQKINVVDESKMNKISNKLHKIENKSVPGFMTNAATRPVIISKMAEYFFEKSVTVKSKRLINELWTFIYKDGKPQAANKNYHDDLVLSLALSMWVRDTALRMRQLRKELTRKALDSIHIDRSRPIFQFVQQGMHDPWKMKVNDDEIDLTQFV